MVSTASERLHREQRLETGYKMRTVFGQKDFENLPIDWDDQEQFFQTTLIIFSIHRQSFFLD